MEVPGLLNIMVHPLADLLFAIMMKTYPDLQTPEAFGLFKAMNIKLVALRILVGLINQIGMLNSKGGGESLMVFY